MGTLVDPRVDGQVGRGQVDEEEEDDGDVNKTTQDFSSASILNIGH